MDERRSRIQILTLVLRLLLLVLNLWQLHRLSDLRGELRSVETNLQMEARRLDERIQTVQRAVQEGDKLIQDWELRSVVVEPGYLCLIVEVSL